MKFYILGISTHSHTFPSLYCRYLPDPDTGLPVEGEQECFYGGFTGTLPDPSTTGLEAIAFNHLEDAQAHIAAEIAGGSTWTYALWGSSEPVKDSSPCYSISQPARGELMTLLHNTCACLLNLEHPPINQPELVTALTAAKSSLASLPAIPSTAA